MAKKNGKQERYSSLDICSFLFSLLPSKLSDFSSTALSQL